MSTLHSDFGNNFYPGGAAPPQTPLQPHPTPPHIKRGRGLRPRPTNGGRRGLRPPRPPFVGSLFIWGGVGWGGVAEGSGVAQTPQGKSCYRSRKANQT